LDAWLALRFKTASIYFDILRECYESYVIYSFAFYLIHMVGRSLLASPVVQASEFNFEASTQACASILASKPQSHHFFPMCWLPNWPMGPQFVRKCKNGVLFYCLAKVLTATATFIMQIVGVYGNGKFSFDTGYIYCTIVNNFTQLWAMYCLVMFYRACKEELQPIRPLPKFLCIKAVVFFSFWQSVGISALAFFGYLNQSIAAWVGYSRDDVGVEELGVGLQDFLICIEMFIAAIAHVYAFSHEDFKLPNKPNLTFLAKVKAVFDVDDVRSDMYGHMKEVGSGVAKIPVKVGNTIVHLPAKVGTSIQKVRGRNGTQDAKHDDALLVDKGATGPKCDDALLVDKGAPGPNPHS